MTALGGREVERTFSGKGGPSTGLSRQNTREPRGQDLGHLGQALALVPRIGLEWFRHTARKCRSVPKDEGTTSRLFARYFT